MSFKGERADLSQHKKKRQMIMGQYGANGNIVQLVTFDYGAI